MSAEFQDLLLTKEFWPHDVAVRKFFDARKLPNKSTSLKNKRNFQEDHGETYYQNQCLN